MWLHVCTGTGTVFSTVTSQRSSASNRKPEREIDYVKAYHILVHQKCVLCIEAEHLPDCKHKTVFTDHKTAIIKETQLFIAIHIFCY